MTTPAHVDNKDSIRILHVDDELSILESTKQILTLNGSFHVTSIASVNDALKLIDAEDFDVVISDYQMPEKDGLELLSELRACGNKIPFILFTGKGREDVVIKALNLGANYYVNKIGKPETIFGELSHVIKQVVKQNRAEMKLALERQRLQTVTKHMSAGLAVISKDFRLLWANDVITQIFGDDCKGKTCYKLINGLNAPCDKCGVHKIFEGGSNEVVHEQVVKDADGQDVWIEITVTPIKDVKGNITAALELVNNITERKKSQAQLKESEEQFRQLFSRMPSGVAVYEAVNNREDFVFKDFNQAAEQIDKISRDAVIGKSVTEVFPGVKKFGLFNVFQRVYQTGAPESFPVKLYKDNRGSGWRENWVYKLPNNEIVAVYNDVTEQKKAEQTIHTLKRSIDQSIFGIALASLDGVLMYINEGARRMWGFSKDEKMEGKTIHVGYAESEKKKIADAMEALKKFGSWTGEVVAKRTDGSLFDVQVSASVVKDVNGKPLHLIAYYIDITEKVKAQKVLKENQAFLNAVIDENPYPMWISDEKGTIIKINKALLKLLKLKEEEIIGKYNVFQDVQVKSQGLLPLVEKAFKGETVNFVIDYNTVDVTQIDLSDRSSRKILNITITPVLDEKGAVKHAICVQRDITAQNTAEKELNNSAKQLELVNEKLSVVGRLTRHDTRNKLAVVANNLYLAKRELGENSKALEHFGTIESGLDQVEKIFEFSRVYEQLGVEELSKVDAGKSFDHAVSLHNIDGIQLINYCNCVTVLADSLLDTLFYNLIDNSLRHGKDVTRICLSCEIDEDWLTLIYEDNGVGIPERQKEKIFREGYGKGTGMGLHMIKIMCEIYGFTIRETGELGKGARFEIDVPKSKCFLPEFVESQSKRAVV